MPHIADFTTEDLAAGILGSTGNYDESLKRATRAIDAAIHNAVKAAEARIAQLEQERDDLKMIMSGGDAYIQALRDKCAELLNEARESAVKIFDLRRQLEQAQYERDEARSVIDAINNLNRNKATQS